MYDLRIAIVDRLPIDGNEAYIETVHIVRVQLNQLKIVHTLNYQ